MVNLKIKGSCKDCVKYYKEKKYCVDTDRNSTYSVEENDYCSFFVKKNTIIRKPNLNEDYFYIQVDGSLGHSNNSNLSFDNFNYDFCKYNTLIRRQEQYINNKLHKLAETLNNGWKPDWSSFEMTRPDENKWFIRYHYDNSEKKLEVTIDSTLKNQYPFTVYFQNREMAEQVWREIYSDVVKLYELKNFIFSKVEEKEKNYENNKNKI
jgi:hypothetical protein